MCLLEMNHIQKKFENLESLDESMHNRMMDLFRKYLLVGGLPDAVNSYISERNIQSVREIQSEIHEYYAADASTNLKSAEFMTSFRQIWKTKRKGLLQKILRIKAVSVSATIRMNSSI